MAMRTTADELSRPVSRWSLSSTLRSSSVKRIVVGGRLLGMRVVYGTQHYASQRNRAICGLKGARIRP